MPPNDLTRTDGKPRTPKTELYGRFKEKVQPLDKLECGVYIWNPHFWAAGHFISCPAGKARLGTLPALRGLAPPG